MQAIPGIKRVLDFVKRSTGLNLYSTGSKVINFSGDLYNVTGSTKDPKSIPRHLGDSWKNQLIAAGLGGEDCYVTNSPAKKKSSHPNFLVGGHMTTKRNGVVAVGADSYLMPLCKWHNSTKRDGVAFEHTKTKMLKLSGYMQGELASSFLLRSRVPVPEPFGIMYFDQKTMVWSHMNLNSAQALKLGSKESVIDDTDQVYVLFERKNVGESSYIINDVNLPEL
jgi:hypothetical protein